MDKISKLRRKPKPPTIETSLDRHAPAELPYEIEDTGPEPDGRTVQRAPMMPSRLSPFRRLRGSAKRARSSSPATGQPVHGVAAVVGKDGMPSASRGASRRVPKMPYFLKSSDYGALDPACPVPSAVVDEQSSHANDFARVKRG